VGVIVDMLGTPRFQAKIVLNMHHRRLVAVGFLGYDLERGAGGDGIRRTEIRGGLNGKLEFA